jgi:hypothetical protein
MKNIYSLLIFIVSFSSFSQEETPETIVQKQVEAYNKKDIEEFLSYYSEDVKIYTFPNTLTSDGKEQLRKSFAEYFGKAKSLHCEISKRIIRKNIVIDEEQIKLKFNNSKTLIGKKNGKMIFDPDGYRIVISHLKLDK